MEKIRKLGTVFYVQLYEDSNATMLELARRVDPRTTLYWPETLALRMIKRDFFTHHTQYLAAANQSIYTGLRSPEAVAEDICIAVRKDTSPRLESLVAQSL